MIFANGHIFNCAYIAWYIHVNAKIDVCKDVYKRQELFRNIMPWPTSSTHESAIKGKHWLLLIFIVLFVFI